MFMKKYKILGIALVYGTILPCIAQQTISVNDGVITKQTEKLALVLTLDKYKQNVLNYNQDIKIATQTFNAAMDAAKAARTDYFPKINGTGTYQYNFNPPDLILGSFKAYLESQNWQIGGGLTQSIYTGGRLSGTYKATQIEEDIASLSEDLSVDDVSFSAETAYWKTSASQAYVVATKKYLKILQDLLQIVQTRFDDGYIGKTDLLKVQTSLKEAELQLSKAEQDYNNNCIILNILMGKDNRTLLYFKDSIQGTTYIPRPIAVENVYQRRPDYLMKMKEIDLQKAKGKIEQSEFLPNVSIGGTAGYGTKPINLDNSNIFSPIVYAQLNIPILQWGKGQHIKNKNKALTISKELSLSLAQDEIRKELTTALNNIEESNRQIGISQENLKIAGESLDLHTFSYQEGRISILDVQSAQLSWLQAYVNLINSFLSNKMALADYKKVTSE